MKRGKVGMVVISLRDLLAAVLWVTILFGTFQTANAQEKPDWLMNYPSNPLYYIGIAGLEKDAEIDTDIRSKVRELALSELISQIEVNVSSLSQTLEEEVNGDYQSSYAALVQLQAQKTIENYEVVDSWESEREYWVYLRLSKSQYQRRLDQKMEVATEQAYQAYVDGLTAFDDQDYNTALSLWVQALGDISAYVDRMSSVDHKGEPMNLFSVLRSSIQNTVTKYKVESVSGPQKARIGRPADQPFLVKLSGTEAGMSIQNIPVAYSFLRGEGEVESPVYADENGIAKATISKLISEAPLQIVKATIGLTDYLTDEYQSPFLSNLLNNLNAPEARFVFKVSGRPIYLDLSEYYLGEKKESEYFSPVLRNIFTERNFVFTNDLSEAELYLELKVNAEKGSETQGFYSVFLDYEIAATNLTSGEEIATYSMADVKGVSITYEKAAASAYETALDSLQTNLIPKLFKQLGNK